MKRWLDVRVIVAPVTCCGERNHTVRATVGRFNPALRRPFERELQGGRLSIIKLEIECDWRAEAMRLDLAPDLARELPSECFAWFRNRQLLGPAYAVRLRALIQRRRKRGFLHGLGESELCEAFLAAAFPEPVKSGELDALARARFLRRHVRDPLKVRLAARFDAMLCHSTFGAGAPYIIQRTIGFTSHYTAWPGQTTRVYLRTVDLNGFNIAERCPVTEWRAAGVLKLEHLAQHGGIVGPQLDASTVGVSYDKGGPCHTCGAFNPGGASQVAHADTARHRYYWTRRAQRILARLQRNDWRKLCSTSTSTSSRSA